jgi:hypothetical protein
MADLPQQKPLPIERSRLRYCDDVAKRRYAVLQGSVGAGHWRYRTVAGGHSTKELLQGRISGTAVSQPRPPAALVPTANLGDPRIATGETITVPLDRMTAMQLRELGWGDPFHPATTTDLATAAAKFLRLGIRTRISHSRLG